MTSINIPVNLELIEDSNLQLPSIDHIVIDPLKCMSRKNQHSGINLQCKYKKKNGDYCNVHYKMSKIYRIDQQTQPIESCSKKIIKRKKIVLINNNKEPYVPHDILKLTVEDINYSRLINSLRHYSINIKGNPEELYDKLQYFFQNRWLDPKYYQSTITSLEPHFSDKNTN